MRLTKIMLISATIIMWSNLQAECLAFKASFDLMSRRAALLKGVAANKYQLGHNIYDASQELNVLQQVDKLAVKLDVERYSLLQYAQLQMDMAKHIEQYWLNLWQSNPLLAPKANQYQDLAEVRQQIQALDQQIYPNLAQAIKSNSCTSIEIQTEFATSFKLVQGIPVAPDFSKLLVNSILAIKPQLVKLN